MVLQGSLELERDRAIREMRSLEVEMAELINSYQEMVELTHKDHGEDAIM
jgi:hypothetical protein